MKEMPVGRARIHDSLHPGTIERGGAILSLTVTPVDLDR